MSKYNTEIVRAAFEKENLILLDDYSSALSPIRYQCSCGRINTTRWSDYLKGCRCGYCKKHRNQIYTQAEIEEIYRKYGCELISEYSGVNVKVKYRCSCGNISQTTFKAFMRGNKKCLRCCRPWHKICKDWSPQKQAKHLKKIFLLKCQSLVSRMIKKFNLPKTRKVRILGYTPLQLQKYIESHPNWERVKYDIWHLDHIFPISAFIEHGITDIKIINHLSNLQPLTIADNCRKYNKYDRDKFKQWLISLVQSSSVQV